MNTTTQPAIMATAPERHMHVLDVLRERNMRWYLGSQLISLTGLMLRSSLLSLLLIDRLGVTKATPYIGEVWGLNVLPGTFLVIFVGVALDHYDKRKILQITASLSALQGAALAYLTYTDVHHVSVTLIMWIAFLGGFTSAVDGLGRNAIIKEAIIDKRNNTLGAVCFNALYTFAMMTGNGISGYLVIWVGYGSAFMLNGISFLVLMLGLAQMDFSHNEKKESKHIVVSEAWQSILNGGHYTFTEPGVRICILLATTITVFGFTYNVILSIINQTMFHGGYKDYSHLATAAGIGSCIGAVLAILFSKPRAKKFIVTGCLMIGAGQIACAYAPNLYWEAITLAISGCGFMMAFLPVRGAIMNIAPKKMIGIVLGFVFTFFYGGMLVSSMGGGWLAKHIGCPAVLVICGNVLILTAIVTPFLPGIEELDKK